MSRQVSKPKILLLDPLESSDIIGPGQELDVMLDWIKHIDSNIQVHVNRGTGYKAYEEISHVVGVFPQTTKLTQNYVDSSTDQAVSQVLTLPWSPDIKESPLDALLVSSKKFSCYIPGKTLQEDWSKRIQTKQIIFFPLQYATKEEEKPYILFKDTIRFIIDVTSPCKNTEDSVRTMLEVVSDVHCKDKRKEIVLLCNEWIPSIYHAYLTCDIRVVKAKLVHEVQRFYNDSIWLLPGSGKYINWFSLQPILQGLPYVIHKDNPIVKTIGDIPAQIQQNILWDGKKNSTLKTIIQSIIGDPGHALENVKAVSLFLQDCQVVRDSREAFLQDIIGENILPVNLSFERENRPVADEETAMFLKILKLGFRKTSGKGAPGNKEDENPRRRKLLDSVFPCLPVKVVGIQEGSVVLLFYLPDHKTYQLLDVCIKNKTIGQDLGLIALGAWEDIFQSSNISGYTIRTSFQKLDGKLSESSFELNATDNNGSTMLHRSAYSGAVKFVNICLEEGHDADKLNFSGQTALHLASSEGHPDVCQILVNKGAAKDIPDKFGRTALHVASAKGHADVCQILLDHCAATDIQDQSGRTALHLASDKGHSDVCQILLDCGAAIDMQDGAGRTALYFASKKGHADVCQILLNYGAAIDKQDRARWTELHFASRKGHVDVCNLLLSHGAVIDKQTWYGLTALHLASREGHVDVCRLLLSHGAPINIEEVSGRTALHLASDEGHSDICQILLDCGAAIDMRDMSGLTPLHLASREGQVDVCRLLLSHGAPINIQDVEADTPVHLALKNGHTGVYQLLVDHGAAI